jgi:GTP-binding protein EngB required for normal cell division
MTFDYIDQCVTILSQRIDSFFDDPCLRNIPDLLPKYEKSILTVRRLLQRQTVNITFFGTFKAGKSTLINAILGENLLPSRANRATGVITKIRYHHQKAACVFERGNLRKPYLIPYEDIAKYLLLDISQGKSSAPKDIQLVEIGLCHPILKGNRVFVDTPGLRDTKELTQITFKELAKADLAVMVLKAGQILSEDDKKVAKLFNNALNGNLIFIINRLDEIDKEEEDPSEVIEWAIADLEKLSLGNSIVGKPRVYATEAKNTLLARQEGIQSLAKSTDGILEFELWLDQFLKSKKVFQLISSSRLGVIDKLLQQLQGEIKLHRNNLGSKIKLLIEQEKLAFQKNQDNRKKLIRDKQNKLVQCRNAILKLDTSFINNCSYAITALISTESDWKEEWRINSCLRVACSDYIAKIEKEVQIQIQEPVSKLSIPFDSISTGFEMPEKDEMAMYVGAGIGLVIGLPFGGAISASAMGKLGSYIGSLIVDDGYKQKILAKAIESAQLLLATLQSRHNIYFDQIEEECSKRYQQVESEQYQPSSFLHGLQETEKKYAVLQIWHDQFSQAIVDTKSLFCSSTS